MASSLISAAVQTDMGNGGPVAKTAYGKVRGVNSNGVYAFKGIPYGASTADANRFMPPRKPEPWGGSSRLPRFGNTESVGIAKGNPDAQQLAGKASAAWARFARSADPSNTALGSWPEYASHQRATMFLASASHVRE